MATSFCGQALAVEHILSLPRAEGKGQVIHLPKHLDDSIAALQLKALGVEHDTMSEDQAKYLESWAIGY